MNEVIFEKIIKTNNDRRLEIEAVYRCAAAITEALAGEIGDGEILSPAETDEEIVFPEFDVFELIDQNLDARELCIEKIKKLDSALQSLASQMDEAGRKNLDRLLAAENLSGNEKIYAECVNAQQRLLDEIKAVDEANSADISTLMEYYKTRAKNVKGNRKLMEKYLGDDELPVGTLLNRVE